MSRAAHLRLASILWVAALLCFIACNRRSAEPAIAPSPPPAAPALPTATGPPWFEDATEASGLRFTHDAGNAGSYFLPSIIGSGAALFDFDGDERLDIYLIQNGGPQSGSKNQLFHQKADGTFENVSAGSGLDVAGFGMGVAIGDVNNDGKLDVLLTEYGGIRLFLNKGDRTFSDVTKRTGLDNIHWATSASFIDYNRDGWLDLVVVNYVDYDASRQCPGSSARRDFCHPNNFPGAPARLFRNLGIQVDDAAVFQDATLLSGLAQRPGPALGVICADLNGDGWPEIFVANDAKPNHLWINQKNGKFVEEGVQRGCAFNGYGKAEGNMGIAFADLDGDGWSDLFVTHLTEETSTLWKQGPIGYFSDRTRDFDLAKAHWRGTGFGVVAADFDHDGHLDVALVNGRVVRAPASKAKGFDWADYAERNQVFANTGAGKFRDLSIDNPAFCGSPGVGRGLCLGDIFGTGRNDLLATAVNGPAQLYRNIAPKAGHWLIVRAFAPEWQRDAYGAVITITAGNKKWVRTILPGSSYLCSNDPRAHFGLGTADRVDGIYVLWPDGSAEDFSGVAADRRLTLRKGEGIKPK